MDRRYFIKGTSAATLSIAGGSGFSAGLNAREFNWRDLLESIQLSKGKPLRLLYPQGCLANLKPIITVFEQLTGVKVEVKQAGFDSISNTMLKNSLFGKSEDAFDIAIPSTFYIPDLAEAGVIANLDSVAENAVWENVVARQSIQSLYPHGDKY